MIEYLTTTYPKNMKSMSFDGQFEALSIKVFVTTFGNILTEIGTFQVGTFKFINILGISNFDIIL